jgi:beta-N-acetylhexosaminidase
MKPAIVGIAGPALSLEEAACLRRYCPTGIILFARNIEEPAQLGRLMVALRDAVGAGAEIMIDQEGGRVARLRPPHWRGFPPANRIGALHAQDHAQDHAQGQRLAWLTGALIGLQCATAGFSLVAAPVLDVASPDGHDVIGDRAFSSDPGHVAVLGRALADGLLAAGVAPVGKHAPGHGRARADSHVALPVLDDIADSDLVPFMHNNDLPWMMTAHIRYSARDMQHPATHSHAIISQVIRGRLGFDGVLVTDDLAMQALSGAAGARAARALEAGCDIALHCSGLLEETIDVLDTVPDMTEATARRLAASTASVAASRRDLDEPALAAEYAGLLR